ncbi:MAG: citramalate synthase [Acidobacteria bacterium]|nr:citramalate synthase [Acidobacteriota bacterium]
MKIFIYDTTLRDGSQSEHISFSVEDKLHVAGRLDEAGFHYIEGGWPGSNPKDLLFFQRARRQQWKRARIAAFGSTRHAKNKVQKDPNVQALLDAHTPTVTIFGKTWDLHVRKALGISLEENLQLISETVAYLKDSGKEVIYDAEHFFDGWKARPDYALKTLRAAEVAGADFVVLCDTNGGSLPDEIKAGVLVARQAVTCNLGIHTHNDSDTATANSIVAVESGCRMIQGTVNGLGERCGNANLCSVIPILELKLNRHCIGKEKVRELTTLSRYVAEVGNIYVPSNLPFVGTSAFAHKGGIHVSAVLKHTSTYEHLQPESVGNRRRVLISDMSGKSNVVYKAKELSWETKLAPEQLNAVIQELKQKEYEGFQYEGAEASFQLLVEDLVGKAPKFFTLEGWQVLIDKNRNGKLRSQASIKLKVGNEVEHVIAEGNGPVNALNRALKKSLSPFFPSIERIHLNDYKVRVIDTHRGTAAKVRVLIESTDGQSRWNTIGVSENVLEASWQALVDGIRFYLGQQQDRSSPRLRPAQDRK